MGVELKVGDFVIPYGKYAKEFFTYHKLSHAQIHNYNGGDSVIISYLYHNPYLNLYTKSFRTFSLKSRSPYRVVKMPELEWE